MTIKNIDQTYNFFEITKTLYVKQTESDPSLLKPNCTDRDSCTFSNNYYLTHQTQLILGNRTPAPHGHVLHTDTERPHLFS